MEINIISYLISFVFKFKHICSIAEISTLRLIYFEIIVNVSFFFGKHSEYALKVWFRVDDYLLLEICFLKPLFFHADWFAVIFLLMINIFSNLKKQIWVVFLLMELILWIYKICCCLKLKFFWIIYWCAKLVKIWKEIKLSCCFLYIIRHN